MTSEILKFDKANAQSEFKYMAKNIETGQYEIGYIVIDQPWYSDKSDWTYYIFKNKSGAGGLWGAADLGLIKTKIDPNTIEPFTQIANIKYNQSVGINSVLVEDFVADATGHNMIAFIGVNDDIPLELWM